MDVERNEKIAIVADGNSWRFKRHADGTVEIRVTTGTTFLDPADWAVVIAAMSEGKSYQDAQAFNQGRGSSATDTN